MLLHTKIESSNLDTVFARVARLVKLAELVFKESVTAVSRRAGG